MIHDEDYNGDYPETNITTVNGKDYVFFWGGPFSNWLIHPFTHNGVEYTCSEQYMMEQKALTFGDFESAKQIMASRSPASQKAIGRQIKNFDYMRWQAVCQSIMVPALVSKFTSTPRLKETILGTGDACLVEASPYDAVWGVALSADDPRILDETQWRGMNLLGIVLMAARTIIRAQESK